MSISPQDAETRQERFVGHVRTAQSLWVLMLGGGFANFVEEGVVVVPVWSASEKARTCAAVHFPHNRLQVLRAAAFLDLLGSLSAREAWVAVELTDDLGGIFFPPGASLSLCEATVSNQPQRPTRRSGRRAEDDAGLTG